MTTPGDTTIDQPAAVDDDRPRGRAIDFVDFRMRRREEAARSRRVPPELKARGYVDEYRHHRVCGTCGWLYELNRPDGLNQGCRCCPAVEPRWPGRDFNERARLCGCCGVEVLASGSRFSPFFCRTCQVYAIAATLSHGRLVFPIGRHSAMHTWVPEQPFPSLPADGGNSQALARTVGELSAAISAGTDLLEAWSGILTRENLQRLQLPSGVSLRDYLSALIAAEGRADRPGKLGTFGRLCAFAREQSAGTARP